LERIKQEFDPACSYVIFEKAVGLNEKPEFRQVLDILVGLNMNAHQVGFFLDETRGKLLLVVKFDPAPTDRIMQEFLRVGLPEDVTFYAYGSCDVVR
jgi:hypothetical protein